MPEYTCKYCGTTDKKAFYYSRRWVCKACTCAMERERHQKKQQNMVKLKCPSCKKSRWVSQEYANSKRCKSICASCGATEAHVVAKKNRNQATECPCGVMLPAPIGYRCGENGDSDHAKYWNCPHQNECLDKAVLGRWDGWTIREVQSENMKRNRKGGM